MHFTMDERLISEPVNCVAIRFDPQAEDNAQRVSDALAAGNPSIVTVVLGRVLVVAVDTLLEGQEVIVASCLKSAFSR
jgi:hypothetical protein